MPQKPEKKNPSEDDSPKAVEVSPPGLSGEGKVPTKAKPVIQDFQCPETHESSLYAKCKAKKATLRVARVGRSSFLCECGMTFRAEVV